MIAGRAGNNNNKIVCKIASQKTMGK